MSNGAGYIAKRKKILFITPEGGRTGSEMVLWYLLRNYDRNLFEAFLFSIKPGELLGQLPPDIVCQAGSKKKKNIKARIKKAVFKILGISPIAHQLKKINKSFAPDIWFVNTIAVPQEVYELAAELRVRVVTYFHELSATYNLISANHFKLIIECSSTLIGCSRAVCDRLSTFAHPDVRLQYGFIDPEVIVVDQSRVAALKKELAIEPGEFVWIISGTVTYLKGLDYIVELFLLLKDEKFKIIWLGKTFDSGLEYYVGNYANSFHPQKLILKGKQVSDYYNYFSLADGFLMPSRVDSFPLVMLEAAHLRKPIVSFNSGGVVEFVRPGMGAVVNSWNVADLAEEMRKLMHGQTMFDENTLEASVLEYTAEAQVAKFEKMLSQISG